MKYQTAVLAFFAAIAVAAPAPDEAATKVVRIPSKTWKRFYGEQFCDCLVDCQNAGGGAGGEGGVGLGSCMDGCYDYPTPTAGTCEELGDP